MKKVISATLLVVIAFSGPHAFAQQSPEQKSKTAANNPKTLNSTTAVSTVDLESSTSTTDQTDALVSTGVEAQKHYDAALALYDHGRFADAIEAFKQSLKLRPNDPQTNFSLGLAYSRSRSYQESFESFKRATRLKPEWPEAHLQLGVMSYVLGKRNQAVDEYKKLLQLNSPLATVLYRIIKDEVSSASSAERINNIGLANNIDSRNGEASKPPITVISTNSPAASETAKPTSGTEGPKNTEVAQPTSAEAPNTPAPSLNEIYRVGVGDVLDIRLFNSTPGRSTLFTVIAGGLIDLPVAGGPIMVGGLTIDEIQKRISAELKRRAVGDGNQVSVGIRQYSSHSVVVTGLVVNPGTRFLRREAVPLYVILAESQLRNDAGRVVIMRAGSTGQTLDLNDPASMNINVLPGDVISVVGRQQEFYYIAGRINYPGQKPFLPGITLLQAILAAGGTQRQNQNIVEISREGSEARLVTTRFNLKEIKSGRIEDPKLQPGDRIEVLH